MTKASTRIKELLDKLRGDILCGYLKSGDRLPTVRQLMDDFNLSQGSVTRSINVLCEEGMIYKKAGSGVYVNNISSNPKHVKNRTITVFTSQTSDAFLHEETMLANIYLGIKSDADCKINLIHTETLAIPEATLQQANKESDGIILLGEYDNKAIDINLQVPTVGVFMNNAYNGKLSLIGLDPFDAAQQAMSYFGKKVKGVHIISSMLPIFHMRAKIFETYWRHGSNPVLFSPENTLIDFKKEWGYFFSSDTICQRHCEEFFHQTGEKLHKFTHIFSIDGKRFLPKCNAEFYNFPSYSVDWKQIGKYAYEECIYRINNTGTPGRRIFVPGYLKT